MNGRDFCTEQEDFWAGEFGTEYTERNSGTQLVAGNRSLFANIFARTRGVEKILELGANQGLNLVAIHDLLPKAQLSGVEINSYAANLLRRLDFVEVHECSLFDYQPGNGYELVFTKGVLIHLNPEMLAKAYEIIYRSSRKYICLIEYYNPVPLEINYRGHAERLYKRDFAGEMLDGFSDLRLVDYGFVYHRDNNFPADDLTWFLLEKAGGNAGD